MVAATAADLRGEPLRLPRAVAPDPDPAEVPHQPKRLDVRPRLHPGPEDGQHRGTRRGHRLSGHGRGSGAYLGDQPPVHHRERLAGLEAETPTPLAL